MQKFTQSQIFLTQSQFLGSFFDAKFIFDANQFQNRINFSTSSIFTQKSAPKCAFCLFESCLNLFNFLSIIRRLPRQIVSITLPLRVDPATISRPLRTYTSRLFPLFLPPVFSLCPLLFRHLSIFFPPIPASVYIL